MAQLADHPYIVQVFRSEQTADGGAYLVMKYYPPPNLAVRSRAERMSVEEVLRTGIQLASAVETAHRAGIIHRDIKPANVLVSQYGQPGLTDFGIAGRGGHAEDVDEDVGVSVPWSPPEVLYGQSNGDSRSDVYSLAATLWHLLVGPLAVRAARRRQLGLRADAADPGGAGAAHRPGRRARLARAAARARDGQGARRRDRRRRSSWPAGCSRSSRSSACRAPRSSCSTSRARSALAEASAVRPPSSTATAPACAPRRHSPHAGPRAHACARRSPTTSTTMPPTISGGLILGGRRRARARAGRRAGLGPGPRRHPAAQPTAERALPDRRPHAARSTTPSSPPSTPAPVPASRHLHLELRRRRGGRLLPAAGRPTARRPSSTRV